jgi:microcystin-dependent protein
MSALPITITTAGLQELVNAQNTGASGVVIAQMGLSATPITVTSETAVVPDEIKRLGAVAGQVVAPDVIHVSVSDQSQDTYSIRTLALYLDNGVLFAAYSQALPLVEKASAAMIVIDGDIKLSVALAEVIEFTGGGWLNPPASETVTGVVRIATEAEAAAGVNDSRAITPKKLAARLAALLAGLQATLDAMAVAIGGKAATNHSHDAAQVVSGVFNIARIPAIGIAGVTGLVNALAGKADANHAHDAGAVTSGVFNIARIPAIAVNGVTGLVDALAGKAAAVHGHAMGEIAGLVNALAGKADANHAHDAGAVTSGVFNIARIPAIALNGVTGLVDALAGKAAAAHNHDASAVNSGVFALARIPDLPTGKITGLDGALNARAVLGQTVAFNDVTAARGNGTGVIFLGDGAHYLHWDGANYHLNNANLLLFGNPTLHTGNPDYWWPAGRLELYDTDTVPAGARALVANGAAVSRGTYSRLFDRIGTRYGAGDGANTFNLPDWRGVFFRGLDNGRGLDSGRGLGTFQSSQNLAHTHGLPVRDNADAGSLFIEDAGSGGALRNVRTYSEGGSEARPANQALLACITY